MSLVKANAFQDASGGSNAVFSGVANPPNSMGFRNRIINGDMRIDQRNAGASVTQGTSVAYTVDRWSCYGSAASKFTVQRSTTAPAGFVNSLLVTSSSAYTVGASEFFFVQQVIEGNNIADLGWGTANAQAVTLSFQVRSSLTGTFGGTISNGATNRVYPFTYTISAANTFETKTINIAGDTTGTWSTDTSGGIVVNFNMGAGASVSGTAGAWSGSTLRAPTGATSVVGTNGATFYITGVQLEAGTNATNFERRDYGRELIMCQRYYQTAGAASVGNVDGSGVTYIAITEKLAPSMRSAPSGSIYSGVTASFRSQGGDISAASPGLANFTANGTTSFWTQVTGFGALTNFAIAYGRNNISTNGGNFIALSAEL